MQGPGPTAEPGGQTRDGAKDAALLASYSLYQEICQRQDRDRGMQLGLGAQSRWARTRLFHPCRRCPAPWAMPELSRLQPGEPRPRGERGSALGQVRGRGRAVRAGAAARGRAIRRRSTTGGQPHLKENHPAQPLRRPHGAEPASDAPRQRCGRRLLPSPGASLSERRARKPPDFQPSLPARAASSTLWWGEKSN